MTIDLEAIRVRAFHGLLPQEQKLGQDFLVSLRLQIVNAAAASAFLDDEFESTIDYTKAYELIRREMAVPSRLLEHVAGRILCAVFEEFPSVQSVEVKIRKLAPPIEGFDGPGAGVYLKLHRQFLIIDFDGTLADTSPSIQTTMEATFRELGLPVPTPEAIRQTIGLSLSEAISLLSGKRGADLHLATSTYRRVFEEVGTKHVYLFPGVESTLRKLRKLGTTLAIATARGHESVESLLESLGVRDLISLIVACDDVEHTKPHPEAVLKLIRLSGFSPSNTIVVGDTTYDISMARAAGVTSVGVTYGNHSVSQLFESGANYLVDSFNEILPVLLGRTPL